MNDNFIEELTESTLENLENIIQNKTVVGDPLQLSEDVTLLPISKISIGYVTGGSHLNNNESDSQPLFSGGSGGAASVKPEAFVVVTPENIKVMRLDKKKKIGEDLIEKLPDSIEQIQQMIRPSRKRKKPKFFEED